MLIVEDCELILFYLLFWTPMGFQEHKQCISKQFFYYKNAQIFEADPPSIVVKLN